MTGYHRYFIFQNVEVPRQNMPYVSAPARDYDAKLALHERYPSRTLSNGAQGTVCGPSGNSQIEGEQGRSVALNYQTPEKHREGPFGLWLQANVIVDGKPEPLFAAQVTFGRFDRYVPQQELNLLQLAAGCMA